MDEALLALEASRSADWAERVDACRVLTRHAGEAAVDAALCRLLGDGDSTAVPYEVGRALLEAAAPSAVRVFAKQYGADADDDAWDMLNMLLAEDEGLDWERLTSVFISLVDDRDLEVRKGAADVLNHHRELGW